MSTSAPERRRGGRRLAIGWLVVSALIVGGVWHRSQTPPLAGVVAPHRVATPADLTVSTPTPSIPTTGKVSSKRKPVVMQLAAGTPKRLIIPNAGVDTSVETVGLAGTGPNTSQEVPPHAAGWYKYSVKPGASKGHAVMDGHNTLDNKGVFSNISELRRGDPATVVDEYGNRHSYKVVGKKTALKSDFDRVRDEMYSLTGPHRLILVSCGGKWIQSRRTHESSTYVILALT